MHVVVVDDAEGGGEAVVVEDARRDEGVDGEVVVETGDAGVVAVGGVVVADLHRCLKSYRM